MSNETLTYAVLGLVAANLGLFSLVTVILSKFSARWERTATRDNVKTLITEGNSEIFNTWERRVEQLELSWQDFLDQQKRQVGRVSRERARIEKAEQSLDDLEKLSSSGGPAGGQGETLDQQRWRLFNEVKARAKHAG